MRIDVTIHSENARDSPEEASVALYPAVCLAIISVITVAMPGLPLCAGLLTALSSRFNTNTNSAVLILVIVLLPRWELCRR